MATQFAVHRGGKSGSSIRRWGSAIASGIALTLIASCGTVPGAAAEVDGVRIDATTVTERTQTLIDENVPDATPQSIAPTSRSLLSRYQITDLVRHELVQKAAKANHITITTDQVSSFITANGGAANLSQVLTVPIDAIPNAMYDYMVLEELITALPEEGASVTDVQVTLDVVSVTTRAEAVAARERYLREPAAMDIDAGDAAGATQQLAGDHSLLTNPDSALIGVFSAAEGDILIIPNGISGYNVIRVTNRTEEPAQLTAAEIRSAPSLDGFMVLASLVLAQSVTDSEVDINPRFGVWDSRTLMVLPPRNGL